jgi:hypothetical protein
MRAKGPKRPNRQLEDRTFKQPGKAARGQKRPNRRLKYPTFKLDK